MLQDRVMVYTKCPGGGGDVGYSLIWPIRVCAAERGNMVFKVLSLLMMHHDAPCLKTGCLLGLEAFQRV